MTGPVKPQPDNWLDQQSFTQACTALPLVSIDLMLTRPGVGGEQLLLGLRNNRPARGSWFTPGGRIRKNEPLQQAMQRIAAEELKLQQYLLPRAVLLGAWDHFYADSAFAPDVTTHYVNLAYWLRLDAAEAEMVEPESGDGHQHGAWRWLDLRASLQEAAVHDNVKAVVEIIVQRSVNPA